MKVYGKTGTGCEQRIVVYGPTPKNGFVGSRKVFPDVNFKTGAFNRYHQIDIFSLGYRITIINIPIATLYALET